MENLTKFDDFKNRKHGSKLNEGVIKIGNEYVVSDIVVPVSLVNSYIKKIKDETGKNLREMMSDQDVAFRLVKYSIENHLQIDNLPSSIVLGDAAPENVEVNDTQPQENIQPQTDIQDEPKLQEEPKSQEEKTTQEIPPVEGGSQPTPPQPAQKSTQPAQTQGTQAI